MLSTPFALHPPLLSVVERGLTVSAENEVWQAR